MTTKNAERLIIKFVTNQANVDEINELTHWMSESEVNKILFEDFVKSNYISDFVMANYDVESAKSILLQKIRKPESLTIKRDFTKYYKYAAVLVVGFMIAYFYKSTEKVVAVTTVKDGVLIPKEEVITLQAEDGSIQTIYTSDTKNVTNQSGKVVGKQNRGTIVYNASHSSGELVYNKLKIPYGKQFKLQLSDGTLVHLNAGTSLRFPVHFMPTGERQVFLDGEAYFEVAKDKKHPFVVNSDKLNVEVFGTKFNVNAYPDEKSTQVVLVEGKVGLSKANSLKGEMVFLKPGFMGVKIDDPKSIITTTAVNTDTYTSWINGGLVFRNTSFNEIIKKLERHYNVTFINNNKTLGKEVFNARFDDETIHEVLKYFNESFAIKYKIQNNKVIIQ